jgi:hypothetical protein
MTSGTFVNPKKAMQDRVPRDRVRFAAPRMQPLSVEQQHDAARLLAAVGQEHPALGLCRRAIWPAGTQPLLHTTSAASVVQVTSSASSKVRPASHVNVPDDAFSDRAGFSSSPESRVISLIAWRALVSLKLSSLVVCFLPT